MHTIRMVILLAGIALMAVLTSSCATVASSIQARREGVPVWTIHPPAATITSIPFTGSGTAALTRRDAAYDAAVESLVNALGSYVGYNLDDGHRRELLQTGEIVSLGVELTDEYTREGRDEVTVHLLAVARRSMIRNYRRSMEDKIDQAEEQFVSLSDQARRAYARNRDYTAAMLYLEAAQAVYHADTPDSFVHTESSLQQAISILEDVHLESVSRSIEERSFSVRVIRRGRTFGSGVEGASVQALYPVYNVAGRQTERLETVQTDSRGYADAQIIHPGFRGTGRVTLSLDSSRMNQLLQDIQSDERLAGYVEQLYRIMGDKQISYPFSVRSEALSGSVLAAIIEYDRGGERRDTTLAADALINTFTRDGIYTDRVPLTHTTSEEDILIWSWGQSTIYQTVVIGSAEIISLTQAGDRFVATVQGSVRVLDTASLNVRTTTNTVTANGVGPGMNEARRAAFTRFGEIAAATILNL